MKFIERRAEQRRLLMRFAHARLRRMADRAGRKRMRKESRRIGAPHGGDCAAVPVPPLCVCLRTLSRRRAAHAPVFKGVTNCGPFAWEVPGRVFLLGGESTIFPHYFCVSYRYELILSFSSPVV